MRRPYTSHERQKMMDLSLVADSHLIYSVEKTGKHKKLVGRGVNGFRSFAYFTTCILEAKQSIRMDYVMKGEILR